jgi:oxygen-independent coproporphyrinogen III oxidase
MKLPKDGAPAARSGRRAPGVSPFQIDNATDNAGWRRAIEAGRFSTTRGLAFTPEDIARGDIIERLMCDFSIDYGDIAQKRGFAEDAFDAAAPELCALERQGLLEIEGRRVTMTSAGRPFVRLAAAAFDDYLSKGAARHSAAV